jgi:hypothetical protein
LRPPLSREFAFIGGRKLLKSLIGDLLPKLKKKMVQSVAKIPSDPDHRATGLPDRKDSTAARVARVVATKP